MRSSSLLTGASTALAASAALLCGALADLAAGAPAPRSSWIVSLESNATDAHVSGIQSAYESAGMANVQGTSSSSMEMLDIAGFRAMIVPAGDAALRSALQGNPGVAQVESPQEWAVSLPPPDLQGIEPATGIKARQGGGKKGGGKKGANKKSGNNDEARKQRKAKEKKQPTFNPAEEINKNAGGGGRGGTAGSKKKGGAAGGSGGGGAAQNAGQGVMVFVIDTGIDVNHPAFKGANGKSRASIKDFTGEGNNDKNGHGTHVAGTAVGQDFGIARGATVMSLKVFDSSGRGANDRILRALQEVGKAADGKRPIVVNMSLGGRKGSDTPATQRAIQALAQKNVAVVVAAGNDNKDACTESPAFIQEALTVGAADVNGRRASFSNAGKCVKVTAPGVNLISAKPGGGTAIKSGTSMATPVIAGTVASLMGQGLTAKAAQQRLLQLAVSPVSDAKGSPNRAVTRQDIAKAVLGGGTTGGGANKGGDQKDGANKGGNQKDGGAKKNPGNKKGGGKTGGGNQNPGAGAGTPPPKASPKANAVFGVPAFGSA